MLADTHAHLYWEEYQKDLDEVVKRALVSGVTTIINVGVDVNLSKKALKQVQGKLAEIPGLKAYSTIGIHPHEALRLPLDKLGVAQGKLSEEIEELEQIYRRNPEKVVAVGECGLDYYFRELDPSVPFDKLRVPQDDNKALQRILFQAQIDLAKKINLPLIVHCRDDRSKDPLNSEAWDEVLEMVSNHPTILHCYSGLEQTTQKVLKLPDALVSFAATITYPKNEYLRKAAKLLPLEKIVLETDCPFLPPQSKRGMRNEPANVLEIAQLIAQIKNLSVEEVAKQTTENAKQILKIDPSSP